MSKILNLKRRVMARIYFEYSKRFLISHPDYFMFGIFLVVSLMTVSIFSVLINTTNILRNDTFSIFGFFVSAIKNTSWIIQLLIAGFAIRMALIGSKWVYKNRLAEILGKLNTNFIKLRY